MDPLNFPALASAALGPIFTFCFGRLTHLLDSRGAKATKAAEEEVLLPATLEGRLAPLEVHPDRLEQHWDELISLSGHLGEYHRNPDRVQPDDVEFLVRLGKLRSLLETVYGQRITFQGEHREPSGARVAYRVETISGRLVGVKGSHVRNADVTVDAKTIEAGAWVIGVEGDTIG